MQNNNRVKLLSMLTGILLFNGIIQHSAYAENLNNSGNAANGAKIWSDNCARCHNYRSPSEFSAQQWHLIMQHMRIQAGLTDQEAQEVLAFLEGRSAHTQASATIQQNATYTVPVTKNNLQKNKNVANEQSKSQPASGKSGKTIYRQTCVACHGSNGKGAIPGVPDFTNKTSPLKKSDATLLKHIKNGYQSPGSSMAMPPKGGNSRLTNADLKNVLSYIRNAFTSK